MMERAKRFFSKIRFTEALVAIVVIFLMGCVINAGQFFNYGNLLNIVKQSLTIALLAYGMAFVVICGSIDLSVPMGVVLGAYLCLLLCNVNEGLAIVAACIGCGFIGFLNAFLINVCKFPSMIATYAMSMLLKGVMILVIGESSFHVNTLPPFLNYLGFGNLFGFLPFSIIILVLMCFVACYLIKRVPAIRNIYAVGGNEEAAAMMGINVNRTRYIAHILCGIFTGLAGVNLAARINSAVITGGSGFDMMAIASIVIGGVSMMGGRGKMSAGLWGALVMSMLSNVFKLQTTLNYYYEEAVIGIMLIVVLLIQAISASGMNKRKSKS